MESSVNACSNVPGYQSPKCFVTDGDPKGLITEFIQYLISISTKSSSLLRQQYTEVFEALKTARTLNNSESHQLAQILVGIQGGQQTESEEGEFEDDTRDIDLMASDNEDDEEEIESENETARFSTMKEKNRKMSPFIEDSM